MSVSGLSGGLGQNTAASGLGAVGDEALIQELSRYNLDNLLDRYAQTHPATSEKQNSVQAALAMRTLISEGSKLAYAQRQQVIRQVVTGADKLIPTLNDPRQIQQLAIALITYGARQDVDTLENWGEDLRVQASLRPVADLISRLLDRCSQLAREQADKLAEGFGDSPSAEMQKEYAALDSLATHAHYDRLMADYYRVLAMDRNDPNRRKVARAAVEGLKEFDTAESTVQPLVRLRMGQLLLASGQYAQAKKTFATMISEPAEVSPAPTIEQQYEARYFSVLCELYARSIEATESGINELIAWDREATQGAKGRLGPAKTLESLLQYRLELLKGSQEKADTILQQLAKTRPDLQGHIYELLVRSIPDDAELRLLDTLMLKALLQQGVAEMIKPVGEAVDGKLMDRAAAAANEILRRKEYRDVNAELLDDVSIVLPQLLEKQGKDAEAAAAYLTYASAGRNQANRAAAMNNAMAAIARLGQADARSPEVSRLLDQALPIAVLQFGRNDLAVQLGRRLQQQAKFAEAAEAYARVPESDPQYLPAQFQRVHVLMFLGRNTEATPLLLKLLQTRSGEQGAATIYDLLTGLDADLEVARKAGDQGRVKSLLDARAALSGPLVTWARDNPQESIRKATYRYMAYDADTWQQAALAETDPQKRTGKLKQALSLYDKLLDADGLARWRQTVDADKVDLAYGDTHVLLAKALCLYELGDYQEASQRLARLLEDRKLGLPQIARQTDGEVTMEDNPVYWEATYKLYRSNLELARKPGSEPLLEQVRNGLKRLYIREGNVVGGQKWHAQFEALRRQLIPDFKP